MVQDIQYFKTSWSMLTSKPGWVKHVIILGLLQLIPIIGQIALLGYALLWAKRTAWGMRTSPVDTQIEVGEILKYGFFAMIIVFIYAFVATLLAFVINLVLVWIPVLGTLVSIALSILSIFVSILAYIAAVVYTIYNRFKAAFVIPDLFNIWKQDWKGIAKITGMYILFSIGLGLVAAILFIPIFLIVFVPMGQLAINSGFNGEITAEMSALFTTLGFGTAVTAIVLACIVFVILAILNCIIILMVVNACGIWTSQFEPRNWGSIDAADPFRSNRTNYYAQQYVAPQNYGQTAQPTQTGQTQPSEGTSFDTINSTNVQKSGTINQSEPQQPNVSGEGEQTNNGEGTQS